MDKFDKTAIVFAKVIGVVTCAGFGYAATVVIDRILAGKRGRDGRG